jgi:molybdenum cofactor synthesis domain-containing protein
VVTLSDAGSRGEREDTSGDLAADILTQAGFQVVARHILPDERGQITALLRKLCDESQVRLVVTTGGTGLGPRDVTPEATLDVIDRALPGMAEAMRMESLKRRPSR